MPRVRTSLGVLALGALTTASGARLTAQEALPLEALPLVEVPAATAPDSTLLALMISGDGDWASSDKKISRGLAEQGIATVGVKARHYLTNDHPTPASAARDMEGVLRTYLGRWHRDRVVLIGYSRGAGMMPFVMNRLPTDLRAKVVGLVMIGAVENASFEFHLIDLVKNVHRSTDIPLLPEVERLAGTPMLCIYGKEEHDSFCRTVPPDLVEVAEHSGGHQIRDAGSVVGTILDWMERAAG